MAKELCRGDEIEYKRTKSKHGSQRASITIVGDSYSTQKVTPNNDTVLSDKRHDVKRVKMFDTDVGRHISNPVAEWHNLKDYVIQPGVFCVI